MCKSMWRHIVQLTRVHVVKYYAIRKEDWEINDTNEIRLRCALLTIVSIWKKGDTESKIKSRKE